MILHLFAITLLLALLFLASRHKFSPPLLIRAVTGGLLTLNGLVALLALGFAVWLWAAAPLPAQAAPLLQEGSSQAAGEGFSNTALGAALATGLAAIGAGIAVGIAGAAAIGAITEKPEVLGRTLIFVGLAEGIVIYGLIISFLILSGGLGGG